MQPDNFTTYWHAATTKKGYSGVGLFTQLKPQRIERNIFKEQAFDGEGRVIAAEFNSFKFYNVYFPNGKMNEERLKYKLEFYDKFLNHIESEKKNGKKIIFCGDINTAHSPIDLANPKENENISGFLPVERQWIDKVIETGYIDIYRHLHPIEPEEANKRHYSWWSTRNVGVRERNIGWRIDAFFVAKELLPNIVNAFIMPEVRGSDHCPIGITFKIF